MVLSTRRRKTRAAQYVFCARSRLNNLRLEISTRIQSKHNALYGAQFNEKPIHSMPHLLPPFRSALAQLLSLPMADKCRTNDFASSLPSRTAQQIISNSRKYQNRNYIEFAQFRCLNTSQIAVHMGDPPGRGCCTARRPAVKYDGTTFVPSTSLICVGAPY